MLQLSIGIENDQNAIELFNTQTNIPDTTSQLTKYAATLTQ